MSGDKRSDSARRKQALDKLLGSEAFLSLFLDSITDFVTVHDTEYNVLKINRVTERSFGKDVIGRKCYEAYQGRDAICPDCPTARVLATGHVAFSAMQAGTQGRTVEVTAFPVKDEQGSIIAVIEHGRDITERKRAEAALQENEEKLRAIFESVKEGIAIIDTDLHILEVNEASAKMFGFGDRSEMVGRSASDLITARDRPQVAGHLKKTLEQGQSGVVELTLLTAEGKEFPAELSGSLFQDKSGGQSRIVVVIRDITEHKKAEESLRESENRYRNVVERASDGIVVIQDTILKYANARLLEMWGGAAAGFIGTVFTDHVWPEELPKVAERYRRRVAGEAVPAVYETVLKRSDGGRLDVELNAGIIQYEGKAADLVFVRDITQRKRGQEELRRSHEFLSTVLNSTEDAISVIDVHDYRIHAVNQAFLKQYELKEDQVIGRTCYEVTHHRSTPCMPPDHICPVATTIRSGEHALVEHVHYRADGTKTYVEVSASPVRDAGGNIIQVVHTARDITERRQSEEKLRASEEKYRRLIETAKDAIFVADVETGVILDANKQTEALLGRPLNEIIGMHQTQLHPPGEESRYSQSFQNAVEARTGAVQSEVVVQHKDGRSIPVEISSSVVELGGKKVALGIFHDITQRKLNEEALKERESQLLEAQMTAHIGNWHWDLVTGALYWSDENYRMFSLDRDKVKPSFEAFMATVEPSDVDRVKKAVADALSNIKPYNIDIRIIRPDGAKRAVHARAKVSFDEAGKAVRMVGTVQDITERKQYEDALEDSLKRLQKAMDGTVNAIALTSEMRYPYTAGHQRRVSRLACAIAEAMALRDWQVQGLRMAGLLHDIGKIAVPAEILSKPGTLTEMEFNLVKTHAQVGSDILKTIDFPWPIAQMVRQHHERLDGSGYPLGLKGENILLEARILAVADVVEAMGFHRPFRPALGTDKALQEISSKKGVLYDPQVVDACLKVFADGKFALD